MRTYRGATGAFLPESRAFCSHAVLGQFGPPEPTPAVTLVLSDGTALRLREARPGEPPLCWGCSAGRKTAYVRDDGE
jgi:hypothetical protein